jgi:hypothetical protein
MNSAHTDLPDDDDLSQYAAHITELISASPYASVLADEAAMRACLFDQLAGSDDPVTAELGAQLRDGTVDLGSAAHVPAYAEVLLGGLDKLAETDIRAVAAELEALADRDGWETET